MTIEEDIDGVTRGALQQRLAAEVRVFGGALLWLPARDAEEDDRLRGWFPLDEPKKWLRKGARIKSPELVDNRWHVPRSAMFKVVKACVEEFGRVGLFRDAEDALECDLRCMDAEGDECDCGCLGQNHGGLNRLWMTVRDAVELPGDPKRIFILVTTFLVSTSPKVYAGELKGVTFTDDYPQRKVDNWPRQSEFWCASCGTERATVWDHCHEHGFVRAPLCAPCNRWMWSGWPVPPRKVKQCDLGYYKFCLHNYGSKYNARGTCSG
jgi:hypothetical protein